MNPCGSRRLYRLSDLENPIRLATWARFFKTLRMKTTTLPLKNSMNRSSRHCGTVAGFLILFALACFALSPAARAVCQEGCLSSSNTALGEDSLISNTTGFDNTAIGFNALFSNTTGSANTATGWTALQSNTTGFNNTANGSNSLARNTTGINNTATGEGALFLNTTGSQNTADGVFALGNNIDASQNTATGFSAMIFNTTGSSNTSVGYNALMNNTTGSNNIALGASAGINLTTGNFNIDISNVGVAAESRTIRIGTTGTHTKTFIAGISGATVPEGVGVIVGPNGKLGTVVSSERFKEEIKPMDKASEAILALKPVTFRYKPELDPVGILQFGLVAEDVEKVNPNLVARDEQENPYTVRYEAVNAMLLNEFLKARRQIDAQQKQIEALTQGLQKVSAQIELSKFANGGISGGKPAPEMVANNQ
jgi:trimeric autotransporter adhesin